MAAIDSEVEFQARLETLGLERYSDDIKARGWGTFGTLAFATSYVPGQPDDRRFIEDVVTPILGRQDHPLAAQLRRLFFEAELPQREA